MPKIASTAHDMISGMTPKILHGQFIFISTNDPDLIAEIMPDAISSFKEAEALSMLIPIESAKKQNLNIDQPMRCITLNVYSSLAGIGLTAAVASALADNEIPCNMVAAYHHDHVFVPAHLSDKAMTVLSALQEKASKS